MTAPAGYRPATPAEARAWVRGEVIDIWNSDTRRRYAATVERWNESGVLVRVCDPEQVSAAYWPRVALDVFDPDMEDGPSYAPRSGDGAWVAVVRDA